MPLLVLVVWEEKFVAVVMRQLELCGEEVHKWTCICNVFHKIYHELIWQVADYVERVIRYGASFVVADDDHDPPFADTHVSDS